SAALNAALVASEVCVPSVVKSDGRAISHISATIATTIQMTPSVTLLARFRTRPHQASHIAPRMTTQDQQRALNVSHTPLTAPSTVSFSQSSSDRDAAAWYTLIVVRSMARTSVNTVLATALPIIAIASEQPMSTAYQYCPAMP